MAARELAHWAERGWLRKVRRGLCIPVPVEAEHESLGRTLCKQLGEQVGVGGYRPASREPRPRLNPPFDCPKLPAQPPIHRMQQHLHQTLDPGLIVWIASRLAHAQAPLGGPRE
jgi:hypothetical protein